MLRQQDAFYRATLDSLDEHIAVLDATGTTIATNAALERFVARNPGCELRIGVNYLEACETASAHDGGRAGIARALREMLAGDPAGFTATYEVHPDRASTRWFGVRATSFRGEGPGRVVMLHYDWTDSASAQRLARARQRPQRDHLRVVTDSMAEPVAYVLAPLESAEGDASVIVFSDITPAKVERQRLHAANDRRPHVRDLHEALDEQRFELYAQPILDLHTGATVSHELLLRMRERDGTIRLPGTFLPAAERSGLIRQLDRWVIHKAARLAGEGHRLELNLSALSLSDPGLYDDFAGAIAGCGADPGRIVIELTETAVMQNEMMAAAFVERVAALGCRLALDDFGTGFGGFSYLKNLPVDFLKIDTEFVRDLRTNLASRHVVHAVIGLARSFGYKTVAEGVEDDVTLGLLREMGVDYAQGFEIGAPEPLDDTLYSGA